MEIKRTDNVPELIGIEYPGIIKNVDKMIATLGGIEDISRDFIKKDRLQVRFHPENMYCKPAFGERHPSNGFLMKIRTKKSNKKDINAKREICGIEMVGFVRTMYKFNNLCDFQFLPIQKNEQTNKTECFHDDIVPRGILDSSWFTERTDVPFFLPPPIFCRVDTINTNILKNETKSNENETFSISNRPTRTNNVKIIPFSLKDPIPTKPKKNMPDILKANMVTQRQHDIVYEMFQKRPIWTKGSLKRECEEEVRQLSVILASVAFQYSTGPWRNCFVRYNYDPRKNFDSRFYQMLDFRVRRSGGFKNELKAKRSKRYFYKMWGRKSSDEAVDSQQQQESIFNLETIPPFRAKHYQFCDIHVPAVHEMLEKLPSPLAGAVCNEKYGWLPSGFMDECRNILTEIAKTNMLKQCREKGISMEELKNDVTSDVDDDSSNDNSDNDSDNDDQMDVDEQ